MDMVMAMAMATAMDMAHAIWHCNTTESPIASNLSAVQQKARCECSARGSDAHCGSGMMWHNGIRNGGDEGGRGLMSYVGPRGSRSAALRPCSKVLDAVFVAVSVVVAAPLCEERKLMTSPLCSRTSFFFWWRHRSIWKENHLQDDTGKYKGGRQLPHSS
eukprot:gene9772-biopygen16745